MPANTATPLFEFEEELRSFEEELRSFEEELRSFEEELRSLDPLILWISSVINTVLPTPAPPIKPIFPPFKNGATKSITLMPVSRISEWAWSVLNTGALS